MKRRKFGELLLSQGVISREQLDDALEIQKKDGGLLGEIMRTEEDSSALMHLLILAHVVMAGAFVWIYQRGNEDKPWLAQGLRFGIAIALLAPVPTYTIYYVVQQMPGTLAVQQSIGDGVVVIVVALVTAYLNRGGSAA